MLVNQICLQPPEASRELTSSSDTAKAAFAIFKPRDDYDLFVQDWISMHTTINWTRKHETHSVNGI
jgi:hypothetical protein